MRTKTPIPKEVGKRLAELAKKEKNPAKLKQMQMIILRVKQDLDAATIAEHFSVSTDYVRQVQARFLKEGEVMFTHPPLKKGRKPMLSEDESVQFLKPFEEKAAKGQIPTAGEIWQALEKQLGFQVSDETVYRLLRKHRWRKLVPRPSHPKKDPGKQEVFKKTSKK